MGVFGNNASIQMNGLESHLQYIQYHKHCLLQGKDLSLGPRDLGVEAQGVCGVPAMEMAQRCHRC